MATALKKAPRPFDWSVIPARARTTPRLLKTAFALSWFLALVLAWRAWTAVDAHRHGLQVIGKDSAPSIIAAQQIKANLAALHANAARTLLEKPGQDSQANALYLKRREQITEGILTAAGNITFGDAERIPLQTMLTSLGQYEECIGRTRALQASGDAGAVPEFRKADRLLQETLLLAADALDKANRQALEVSYTRQHWLIGWSMFCLLASGVLYIGVLLGTQVFLYHRTRRVLNPALLTATTIGFTFLVNTTISLREAAESLRKSRADCFESIDVLEQARADAYCALGLQRLRLLDPAGAERTQQSLKEKSNRLVMLSAGMTSADLLAAIDRIRPDELRLQRGRSKLPANFQGHLARELSNIVFDGEQESAIATLKAWLHWLALDQEIRQLEQDRRPETALTLSLGTSSNQGSGVFAQFDEALARTLAINHQEFDRTRERGFRALSGYQGSILLVTIGGLLLAFLGLRPRMKEYEIQKI